MYTADGHWYFTCDENVNVESDDDDDDDDDDADDTTTKQNADPDTLDTYNETKVALAIGEMSKRHFRGRADPGKLNPLFEAAARAAAQMPRLQRMTLRTEVKAQTIFNFAMTYVAPWEAGSRNVDMHRLDWDIGPLGYKPEESILEIWRQAKGKVEQSVREEYLT